MKIVSLTETIKHNRRKTPKKRRQAMKSPDIVFWVSAIDEAMSFAVLPADHPNAEHEARFGLVEEVGEVAGIFKRQARGDKGGELDTEKLAKELGDLWWYTVRRAMVRDQYTAQELAECFSDAEERKNSLQATRDAMGALGEFATESGWRQAICLYRLAPLAKMSLREIVSLNLAKLRARKQAGTIFGSGDDR